MKKYADGGSSNEAIPQDIQNQLMDRQQERERLNWERSQREENMAPKKAVKSVYERVKNMFSNEEKKPVKKAKGGSVGGASKRADGIAQRGKTKGRFV